MKISFLISVAALMVATAAQSKDVPTKSALDIPIDGTTISGDMNSDDEIIDMPPSDLVDDNDGEDIDSNHDRPSRFIVWSSPGYKGHKQVTKGTRGCYRLDGGAVGSFEGGIRFSKYGFFKDDRCKGRLTYGWSSAPIHRIDPVIYPRSVKIYENGDRPEPPRPEPPRPEPPRPEPPRPKPPRPEPTKYSLVAWSGTLFTGGRQLVSGMGCQSLNGNGITSFQGEYKYKFFEGPYCNGRKTLESYGGKSNVRKMNPPMHGTKVEKFFSRHELNERAKVQMVDSTPIRFYFRTAEQLHKQAKIYQMEGDLQASYILYMRFCNLVIFELQKHGEFSNPGNKNIIHALKKSALEAMDELARLRPMLDKKYEEYKAYVSQREEMIKAQAEDAQRQELGIQRENDRQKATKEQQDRYWANNPPAQG
ncbi:hypothetical protein BGZ65_009958, partial [Modicella reniformis]